MMTWQGMLQDCKAAAGLHMWLALASCRPAGWLSVTKSGSRPCTTACMQSRCVTWHRKDSPACEAAQRHSSFVSSQQYCHLLTATANCCYCAFAASRGANHLLCVTKHTTPQLQGGPHTLSIMLLLLSSSCCYHVLPTFKHVQCVTVAVAVHKGKAGQLDPVVEGACRTLALEA